MVKSTIAIIFVCVSAAGVLASESSPSKAVNLHRPFKYKASLLSGASAQGSHGKLTPDYLEGEDASGRSVRIPINDIRGLEVRRGSYAATGCLIGASLGLSTAIVAILEVASEPDTEIDGQAATLLTIGVTAGGGLLGALIGAGYPNWDRVDLHGQSSAPAPLPQLAFRIAF